MFCKLICSLLTKTLKISVINLLHEYDKCTLVQDFFGTTNKSEYEIAINFIKTLYYQCIDIQSFTNNTNAYCVTK